MSERPTGLPPCPRCDEDDLTFAGDIDAVADSIEASINGAVIGIKLCRSLRPEVVRLRRIAAGVRGEDGGRLFSGSHVDASSPPCPTCRCNNQPGNYNTGWPYCDDDYHQGEDES